MALILLGFTIAAKVVLNSKSYMDISVSEKFTASKAGTSLDYWFFERAYPLENIPVSSFATAFNSKKESQAMIAKGAMGTWESLGPENVGGRTLCLAFHPTNEDIIFAGSASGGLWKTTTQGVGRYAWEYVPTGFPALGVASIAIHPTNPDVILIGTGEVYGSGYSEPGVINRLTRGTYGIGILKSEDGGLTWSQPLSFAGSELVGVNDIAIDESNPLLMMAATTAGIYRSSDGGDNWEMVLDVPNGIDIEIDASSDVSKIYVSHGNFNLEFDPELSGIYKSVDNGITFSELIGTGLPAAWSGNAKLAIDPSNPNIVYASPQDLLSEIGLFRSTDAGATWTLINDQNIASYQGWFSHDIAVNPQNTLELMHVGVWVWKSTNRGSEFLQTAEGGVGPMGEVTVGIPNGDDLYVHSDAHAVYYHPLNNKVFIATDGGVFVSNNGEMPFTTLNGGLQTLQFYADMGTSSTNAGFSIGGAQDNGSYIYKGNPSWWRVGGSDGMSATVNPSNDLIAYKSVQGLRISKSIDGGNTFFGSGPPVSQAPFSGQYQISQSEPNILYAGTKRLYKTENDSEDWDQTVASHLDAPNFISMISISPNDSDLLYVGTAPDPFDIVIPPKLFKTVDGGATYQQMLGLPDRVCKDVRVDPSDENIAYAVFSGFGIAHLYKTTDGGQNWFVSDNGLPDVPTNTILIDPKSPMDVYVGNDLGVYYSEDAGDSWVALTEGLPDAVMVLDLNSSPSNRKIRIATHGNGMWQHDYIHKALSVSENETSNASIILYPNPSSSEVNIRLEGLTVVDASLVIRNGLGQKLITIPQVDLLEGKIQKIDITSLPTGLYYVTLNASNIPAISKALLKQ